MLFAGRAWLGTWILCVAAFWAGLAQAQQRELLLRVSWGGADPQQWSGRIEVAGGTLLSHRPLGMSVDEHASFSRSSQIVQVHQPTPRTYDAVDLRCTAVLGARLVIELQAANGQGNLRLDASLEELAMEPRVVMSPGGDGDSRSGPPCSLRVERAPGDALRWSSLRDSLVFSPGEELQGEIEPSWISTKVTSPLLLRLEGPQRGDARDDIREFHVRELGDSAGFEKIPISIQVPNEPGVYDLTFRLVGRKPSNVLRLARSSELSLAERKIQFVVVNSSATEAGEGIDIRHPDQVVLEIDPSKSGWWQKVPLWPTRRRGPFGSGHITVWEHPTLGTFARLAPAGAGEASWEAYPLEIRRVGEPHIVEIEYPSDVVQSLGISIVETTDEESVLPTGIDSGIYRAPELFPQPPGMERHRCVVWPRTPHPVLILTNRHSAQPAIFGRIRVLGPPERRLFSSRDQQAGLPPLGGAAVNGSRLIAAYLDRPLFPESFGARAQGTGASRYKDWRTFLESAERMAEYLRYAGYNALVITVAADGGAIYPSQRLAPTPRYDTGAYFPTGQDPNPKDVLELLLRVFDREGLRLIPAIRFSSALPALENRADGDAADAAGLAWTDSQGKPAKSRSGLGEFKLAPYNVLRQPVQDELILVVRELAVRYGHHPSFGGVAVQLSCDSCTILPGADFGFDAVTCGDFSKAMGISLPTADAAKRAALLLGEHRSAWIRWRADRMTELYESLAREVRAVQASSQLYLLAGELLSHPVLSGFYRPSLLPPTDSREPLLELGVDLARLIRTDGIVFARPHLVEPRESPTQMAMDAELQHVVAWDTQLAEAQQKAAFFLHPPRWVQIPHLLDKGVSQPSLTVLSRQSLAGRQNRRRFVHALATSDSDVWIDGGWLLPMGQEASLTPLFSAFAQLPAGRYESVAVDNRSVTVRTLNGPQSSHVYVCNDAPWSVEVTLDIKTSSELIPLGRPSHPPAVARHADRVTWRQRLEPYDLAAARISGPVASTVVQSVQVEEGVPRQLAASIDRLVAQVDALTNRGANGVPRERELPALSNHDFEVVAQDNPIPGWYAIPARNADGSSAAQLDRDFHTTGERSVRLRSAGEPATLISAPFAAPASGRLTVLANLRTTGAGSRPPLVVRVAEEGGAGYAAATAPGGLDEIWSEDWKTVRVTHLDPPPGPNRRYRLRFELQGTGEIWIDNVRLLEPAMEEREISELLVRVNAANVWLREGRLGNCYRFLEGFWPVYLQEIVPNVAEVATRPPSAGTKPEAESAARNSFWNRFRWSWPRWF